MAAEIAEIVYMAGSKVSPGKGSLSHYYFHLAGPLRRQNQPVHQVIAATLLLKYDQKCTIPMCDFEKSSVLHIFTH